MSHRALYRQYRPATFSEMIGQEHITTILKNQVKSGTTAHAYLFAGTRGTGKTSAARILARAVNCEEPMDGEPCGYCRSCKISRRMCGYNRAGRCKQHRRGRYARHNRKGAVHAS